MGRPVHSRRQDDQIDRNVVGTLRNVVYKLKWKRDADGYRHRGQQTVIDSTAMAKAMPAAVEGEAWHDRHIGRTDHPDERVQIATRTGVRRRPGDQAVPAPDTSPCNRNGEAAAVAQPTLRQRRTVRFGRQRQEHPDRPARIQSEQGREQLANTRAPARTQLWPKRPSLRLHTRSQMCSGIHHVSLAGRWRCVPGYPLPGILPPTCKQTEPAGSSVKAAKPTLSGGHHVMRLVFLRSGITLRTRDGSQYGFYCFGACTRRHPQEMYHRTRPPSTIVRRRWTPGAAPTSGRGDVPGRCKCCHSALQAHSAPFQDEAAPAQTV